MKRARRLLPVCLLLALCFPPKATSQPQAVPKLSERALSKASYVKLAREWKEYIEKNGETADALVNLGMAYRYSGQSEAALFAGRRAMRIAPDDPAVLTFMATMLAIYEQDEDLALTLLKHCREVAPDYGDGLTMLAAVYLRRGELEKAEPVLRTIFEQRAISQPLQDYAYNMLIGLPGGAILITNGDNDTFPALALQAGMGFRKDVTVINRNLLNLKAYAEAVFKKHPAMKPKGALEPERGRTLSGTLIKRMVRERKVPLYYSVTVNLDDPGLGFDARSLSEFPVEGLSWRSSGEGLTDEQAARVFLDKYRLDSATDWNFAWDLSPMVSKLMKNYVACMIKTAERENVHPDTKQRLLDKALEIATFHKMIEAEAKIRTLQEK